MSLEQTPANFRELMGFDAHEIPYEDDEGDSSVPDVQRITKRNNVLPTWGNPTTMNMNTLLLENIVQSAYYKNYLTEMTMFQQVTEQIMHSVKHLEPWERGSRRNYGMTGMCGGVRGVSAGGIISTAFCLLYKLFCLKLTRKQLVSMINNTQNVYMRGMGFLYIRYTQPPSDLWAWFEPYLEDDEEIDVRSTAGDTTIMGNLLRNMLVKLDWFGTLFPRIPVPIQKEIDSKLKPKLTRKHPRLGHRGDQEHHDAGRSDRKHHEGHGEVKKTRCSHHLRHHHCRKHRTRCPRKAAKEQTSNVEQKSRSPTENPNEPL